MREQWCADEGNTGAAVVEHVFVVLRLGLRVDGYSDGTDFDRAEKGVKKFRRVEEQKKDALFGTDAESEQGIAGAIRVFQELLIGDPLVAALDSDFVAAAFLDVAVHEVGGDVEIFRQRDQELGRLLLESAGSWEIFLPRKRAG